MKTKSVKSVTVSSKDFYVGVDVDDTAFHIAGLSLQSGELLEYTRKPKTRRVLRQRIHIPDEKDEHLRRLIRSRGFNVQSRKRPKQLIIFNCRVLGLHY